MKWFHLITVLALLCIAHPQVLRGMPQEQNVMKLDGKNNIFLMELLVVVTAEDSVLTVSSVIPKDMRSKEYRDIDLRKGDVIAMVNGRRITAMKAMHELYESLKIGETIKLGVRRGKETFVVEFSRMDPEKDMGGGRMIIKKAETDEEN